MRNRRIVGIVLALAVAGLTVAADRSRDLSRTVQHRRRRTTAAQAGGVFRVEWESSFDFTDGFDPTA